MMKRQRSIICLISKTFLTSSGNGQCSFFGVMFLSAFYLSLQSTRCMPQCEHTFSLWSSCDALQGPGSTALDVFVFTSAKVFCPSEPCIRLTRFYHTRCMTVRCSRGGTKGGNLKKIESAEIFWSCIIHTVAICASLIFFPSS